MLTKENLRGIWGSLMNPWDESNRFDEGLFKEDKMRLAKTGVQGLYTTGTTGEFYTMDEVEFHQMVKVFAEAAIAPQ